MARDWIFDAINGDDLNGGTGPNDALRGITAAALSAVGAGDRLLFRATNDVASHYRPLPDGSNFHAWRLALSNLDRVRLMPYDDVAPVIRGDFVFQALWTDNGDGTHSATLPASGLRIDAVTFNYDSSLIANTNLQRSAHSGLLMPLIPGGASAESITGTAWRFTVSGTTLRCNFGGQDPNAPGAVITVVKGAATATTDESLIALDNCHGCEIHGIVTKLAYPANRSTGAGIYIANSRDALIQDCEAHNHGLHCIELVAGGAPGSSIRGGRIIRCFAQGSVAYWPTPVYGTPFVAYSHTDPLSVRFASCKALACAHLDGAIKNYPTQVATAVTGFYHHADGVHATVEDIEFRECVTDTMLGSTGAQLNGNNGYAGSNPARYTGSRTHGPGRPVRLIDCQSYDDTTMTIEGEWWILRGKYRFVKAGPQKAASSTGSLRLRSNQGGGTWRCNPLLEACEMIWNLRGPDSAGQYAIRWSASDGNADLSEGITIRGCTLIEQGSSGNFKALFALNGYANITIRCEGSRVGSLVTQASDNVLCLDDTNIPAAQMRFRANHYIGFHATNNVYSRVSTRDSKAEWTSVIENGVGPNAPRFSDGTQTTIFVQGADLSGAGYSSLTDANARGEAVSWELLPPVSANRRYRGHRYGAHQMASIRA